MGSPATMEEEKPLLPSSEDAVVKEIPEAVETVKPAAAVSPSSKPPPVPLPDNLKPAQQGWIAAGLPIGRGSVVGQPVARSSWNSELFSCLGRSDEFCSSDLEVCCLGTIAPCMLYGSNVERLHGSDAERLRSSPRTFAGHCLAYAGLCLLGQSMFGCNLAPCLSFHSRTALRREYNLEGSCEAFFRACGCCDSVVEDKEKLEGCETMCDFATHFFCQTCALCQEGRELRRRVPHPGFNGRPVTVMILPPTEQAMARGA